MRIDFGCQHCGEPVSVDLRRDTEKIRCTHCGRKLVLPTAVSRFPRPHVPSTGDQAAGAVASGPLSPNAHASEAVLAGTMPWVISALFHLGLVLIMAFVAMIVIKSPTVIPQVPTLIAAVPEAPPLRMAPAKRPDPDSPADRSRADASAEPAAAALSSPGVDRATPAIDLRGWLRCSRPSLSARPTRRVQTSGLFAPRAADPASQIVFVIDRSGSMMETFDTVRREIIETVGHLDEDQAFHVILFADGMAMENPPRRLVTATPHAKRQLVDFLVSMRPEGRTDPEAALKRAFAALRTSDTDERKLIHLLTDAVFPDHERTLRLIRRRNPPGPEQVRINTILYGRRPAEAVKVMKLIAAESGGRYKYVSLDE